MISKKYTFYINKWKVFTPLILFLCFVVLLLLLPSTNNALSTFFYYLAIVLFGSGSLLLIYYLFNTSPRIVISKTGIWDFTMKSGEVRWEDIKEVQFLELYGQKYISLSLNEDCLLQESIKKRSAIGRKFFGLKPRYINVNYIDADKVLLCDFIVNMIKSSEAEREFVFKKFKVEEPNNRVYLMRFLYNSLLILLLVYASYYYMWIFWGVMIATGLASLEARWRVFNPAITKACSYIAFIGVVFITLFALGFFTLNTQLQSLGEKIEIEINHFGTENGRYPRNIDEISKNLELSIIQQWQLKTVTYKLDENQKEHLEYTSPKGTIKEYDTLWNEWMEK